MYFMYCGQYGYFLNKPRMEYRSGANNAYCWSLLLRLICTVRTLNKEAYSWDSEGQRKQEDGEGAVGDQEKRKLEW
jgi:hypothetical protein